MSKLTNELKGKVIGIIRDNYFWNEEDDGYFTYFIQPQGYDDKIPDDNCANIIAFEDPEQALEAYLDNMAYSFVIDYYRDDLWSKIHSDIDDLVMSEFDDYNDIIDEIAEFVDEHVSWIAKKEDWDREICLNIIVDSGDKYRDYTCNNILNYCGELPIKENSSILWLAKQQGKEMEFRKAIADYPKYSKELERRQESVKEIRDLFRCKYQKSKDFYDEKVIEKLNQVMKEIEQEVKKEYGYDTFMWSVIEELENLPSMVGALTFCVKTTLLEAIEIISKKQNIKLSKDTTVGLFDPYNGGGSCMSIEGMEKDVVIPYENIGRIWIDVYRHHKYDCIHDIYGATDGMWTGELVA